MYNTNVVVVLLLVVQVSLNVVYSPLTYNEIVDMWRKRVSQDSGLVEWKLQKQASMYALPNNDCNGECQYLLFEYTAPDYDVITDTTVFIVAGFHGIEAIGPWIVSYAYPYLIGKHLLIMPIANPSGYVHGTREEFPSKVDPNRDFPFDMSSDNCMVGITSRLMDFIYRNWKIDMSITIHQGGQEIAWNWGNPSYERSLTEDSKILAEIGNQLQIQAGSNPSVGMKQLINGTMNEIIYPVSGSFEDWAYAASWSPGMLQKCKTFDYAPYPKDMHNGLVYIFEAAPHNIQATSLGAEQAVDESPVSTSNKNGFVTRGIRLLRQLLNICYPSLKYWKHPTEHALIFAVSGCWTAKLSLSVGSYVYRFYLNGSKSSQPNTASFEWKYADPTGSGIALMDYQFICDKNWLGVGKTRFGKGRIYRGKLNVSIEKVEVKSVEPPQPQVEDYSNYIIMAIFTCVLAVLFFVVVACRRGSPDKQQETKPQTTQRTEDNLDAEATTEKELQIVSGDELQS